MKSILISLVVLVALAGVTSCGNNNESDARRSARESLNVDNGTAPPAATTPNPIVNNPAQATAGTENHYICPNNCEGSGGATQVACPVCGTQYVHNQAFHTQAATPGTPPTQSGTPATPPAAQNAAGVFHYTCPSGHDGGAGTAGTTCATCGTALVHNASYHTN
jgi:hypothetical protein